MFIWLWIIALIVLIVLELATENAFVSIWFAFGAVFGLISAIFGIPFVYQVVIFLFTSVAAILLFRPMVKKYMRTNIIPTNADRILGMQTRLLKSISLDSLGEVKVNGVIWNATTYDQHKIEVGSIVEIKAIDGTKLIVEEV